MSDLGTLIPCHMHQARMGTQYQVACDSIRFINTQSMSGQRACWHFVLF